MAARPAGHRLTTGRGPVEDRTEGPRFLDSELTQLQRLARIAVKVEVMAGNGNGAAR